MSESQAYEANNTNGDDTQPTAEILNALQALNNPEVAKSESQENRVPTPTEYDSLHSQLRASPNQPETWKRLVDLTEADGDPEKIKATYEALLKHYPNTSSAQIAFLSHFIDPAPSQFAVQLFNRFLRTSPSVELWKFYMTYVRRVNNDEASNRDDVRKAYEFALNHVGQDKDSGELWSDYIQFIKSRETTNAWEQGQKMDALRKVYHRAVQIPLDNVERLWHEYEAWEADLNKITAKKFMADLSPAHMQARTVLRQLQKHLAPLFPPLPPASSSRPGLYLPALPTFNPPERALVGAWKNYLKWEESNPLEIEEKDKATLTQRIQGVYRKALIRMRFYSEIWFMAYIWTRDNGKADEALEILKQGLEANPSSFILTFAYAEELEGRKQLEEVHATYDRFLAVLRADLDALEERIKSANSSLSSISSSDTIPAATTTVAASGLGDANNGSFNSQSSDDKPPRSKELAERRSEYGMAWVMYMRFGRRAENVRSSRNIFAKARKDTKWTPWEVYEAAALMEYHGTAVESQAADKTTTEAEKQEAVRVASRIFEKGMSLFGDEIDFVVRHLGFLISIKDENNARALFERVIPTFPADRARPLWERWARYEYQYGDLDTAHRLEKRIAEAYPQDPPIKRFAQRNSYLGIDAIAARDLGFAMARQSASSTSGSATNALGRTETQQSLLAAPPPAPSTSHKRPSSPDHRKRDDNRPGDYGPAPKRARPQSPPRERWERRRFGGSPPPWERDRSRDRDAPPPSRRMEREREEKGPVLPNVLSWFMEQLPPASSFDGPVFRTDDLMHLFRNAVIPSTGLRARSPPPPPRGGGRPPPDYGPYQGPGGGRGGRRY